jgi:quinol monooxygenase YgiN
VTGARTIELARFKVRPDQADELLAEMSAMHRTLQRTPGFVSLRLVRSDERNWLHIVEWRSRADGEAAADTVPNDPNLQPVFAVMTDVVLEYAELVAHVGSGNGA